MPSSPNSAPFLREVKLTPGAKFDSSLCRLPILSSGTAIRFSTPVTFFVGENGSGKSTILEAIADECGFNLAGGSRNHVYRSDTDTLLLAKAKLSWIKKTSDGYFVRSETFYNFATYVDDLAQNDPGLLRAYGNRSLHDQSHGEAFMSLFTTRFRRGLYLLDEPEAALSPGRQLAFLALVRQLVAGGHAQLIIATHSPILIAYPGATVFQLDESGIKSVKYSDTEHFRTMRDFVTNPERYLHYLFTEHPDE